jgi:hypothetical protein
MILECARAWYQRRRGVLIGGDVTHYLVVSDDGPPCKTLSSSSVQLGAELSGVVGPVGRGANCTFGGDWTILPRLRAFPGLFVGMESPSSTYGTHQVLRSRV